jgi:hypothetical protein
VERSGTIVMEDGAGPHKNRYSAEVYTTESIKKLDWPANSPDLNAIKPCWMWIKRETTRKGPINSKAKLTADWETCWENLPQLTIQAWIERIQRHVKEVVRLGGGNEYKEGRFKGQEKRRIH